MPHERSQRGTRTSNDDCDAAARLALLVKAFKQARKRWPKTLREVADYAGDTGMSRQDAKAAELFAIVMAVLQVEEPFAQTPWIKDKRRTRSLPDAVRDRRRDRKRQLEHERARIRERLRVLQP